MWWTWKRCLRNTAAALVGALLMPLVTGSEEGFRAFLCRLLAAACRPLAAAAAAAAAMGAPSDTTKRMHEVNRVWSGLFTVDYCTPQHVAPGTPLAAVSSLLPSSPSSVCGLDWVRLIPPADNFDLDLDLDLDELP
jgi:hypothetical protein